MRLLINGVVYDSGLIPVVMEFDENEQELFGGMKKFVSAPPGTTKELMESLLWQEL